MPYYISPEKLKEFKKELEKRKTVLRQQIAKKIQEARMQGDISENAEYTDAKEAQAFNEGRIIELENLIKNAVIISRKPNKDKVHVGSKVVVKDKSGKKREFYIVGSDDADPEKGKISNDSPLGQAFLNRKKGDTVIVKTPKGKMQYTIMAIK